MTDGSPNLSLTGPAALRRPTHQVDAPTLVLWADEDAALGVGLLRGIEEVVPRSEVHVLDNCSHWVQQDKCVTSFELQP